MPGIARLTSDLLSDIMLSASSIDEKFALAQVSPTSKADCSRVPLTLERSGSTTMLHIRFHFFTGDTNWAANALTALVPYVARIETLAPEVWVAMERVQNIAVPLSLSAPQLRTLDIERFAPENLDTILVPSLQDI
ncbi:hypothetical protein C8R44DRAFT_883045 [Mycena epipterygia]|nr:hypothetical protein C8R44DRAFT_883045 [Mycena epipterygia]